MSWTKKVPYYNHARRHLPTGSDPLIFASASAYCHAAHTIESGLTLAQNKKLDLSSASATDTTIFSLDTTNHVVKINVGGTYLIWSRVAFVPTAGNQVPTNAVTYPYTGVSGLGQGTDVWGTALPHAMATGALPVVGVNNTLYTWGMRVMALRNSGTSPLSVQPWVICTGDATGGFSITGRLVIFKVHDGDVGSSLTSL